jgi:hypothetical protein
MRITKNDSSHFKLLSSSEFRQNQVRQNEFTIVKFCNDKSIIQFEGILININVDLIFEDNHKQALITMLFSSLNKHF